MLGRNSVLSFRDFRNLWLGQTISQFGDAVYALVLLFMAGHVTKDPMVVGIVGVLQALPYIFLGPIAGMLADRLDRRKMLVFSDFSSVIITTILAAYAYFNPLPHVYALYAAALSLACVNVFFAPARSAAIPRLVPADRLSEANGLAMATQQFMGMVGLALSAGILGLVFKFMPQYFFFSAVTVNTVTFGCSAYFLSRLPSIRPDRTLAEEARAEGFVGAVKHSLANVISETKEGVKIIRDDQVISIALLLNIFGTLFISGFMVVYIAVNQDWYGGAFSTLAWIELSFAVTMVIFSIVVGKMNIRRPGLSFAWAQGAIGLMVVAMAWSKPYWLFIVMNALCGVVLPFIILPLNIYMQTAVHDSFRGRVNSAWSMVTLGMMPIGIALTGFMLKLLGIEISFIIMGVGLALSGFAGFLFPKFIAARIPDVPAESSDVEPAFEPDLVEDEREVLEPLT